MITNPMKDEVVPMLPIQLKDNTSLARICQAQAVITKTKTVPSPVQTMSRSQHGLKSACCLPQSCKTNPEWREYLVGCYALFVVVKVTLTTNVRVSQLRDQAALDIVIDDTQPGHGWGPASLCIDLRSLKGLHASSTLNASDFLVQLRASKRHRKTIPFRHGVAHAA